jgi:hypothetical protein
MRPCVQNILAQAADEFGVFREALDQNGAGAVQRGLRVGDALAGVDEGAGALVRVAGRIGEQLLRQRGEARLPRDRRLAAPLRLVGQIDVLEPRLGVGRLDLRAQAVVELALFGDRLEHRLAPVLQLAQIAEPLLQQTQLRVSSSVPVASLR